MRHTILRSLGGKKWVQHNKLVIRESDFLLNHTDQQMFLQY